VGEDGIEGEDNIVVIGVKIGLLTEPVVLQVFSVNIMIGINKLGKHLVLTAQKHQHGSLLLCVPKATMPMELLENMEPTMMNCLVFMV
jgi:hypothetical protein